MTGVQTCALPILKTAYHFLLLLVGFDTLSYRKDYDRSPILVGHHRAHGGGGKTPMDSDEGGHSRFGPQPDTAPEPPVVPVEVKIPRTNPSKDCFP